MEILLWIKKLPLDTADSLLIIHHWDTDGICSAALFKEFLRESKADLDIDCVVPVMGTYELKPDNYYKDGNIHLPEEKKYNLIAVLDYSVPARDIIELNKNYGVPIMVYDHHLRDPVDEDNIFYNNPVALGEPGEDWPSCTWVMKNRLGLEITDLVILGIAADLEERFLPEGFKKFPQIKDYIQKTGFNYEDYVKAKDFIDIHYKENDREMLRKLSEEVLKLDGNPEKIMNRSDWKKKQDDHMEYLNKLINRAPNEVIKGVLEVHEISSSKNIISTLTRKLAAQTDCRYVMVVNSGFFKDRIQIYVRRNSRKRKGDTQVFKQSADSLGGQAGGKTEVAGIILPAVKLKMFMNKIRSEFN